MKEMEQKNKTDQEEQRIVRVGSRESKLAAIQSQLIMEQVRQYHPEITLELVTMKTTGDKILHTTLDKIGGKGLFVKELDKALAAGSIDFAVHSLKDMPVLTESGFIIAAYSQREDPRDALVLPLGQKTLDLTKPIGCASQRRSVQLQKLFPGCTVKPVRGNVLTRLEKLDRGEYGALVLAYAGLKRLGLQQRVSRIFSPQEMVPAAGQGIMAVEGRIGDDYTYLKETDDQNSRIISQAEQAFVRELNGGCSAPVAAYAQRIGDQITLIGMYCEEGATDFIIDTITGSAFEAEALGIRLAQQCKK